MGDNSHYHHNLSGQILTKDIRQKALESIKKQLENKIDEDNPLKESILNNLQKQLTLLQQEKTIYKFSFNFISSYDIFVNLYSGDKYQHIVPFYDRNGHVFIIISPPIPQDNQPPLHGENNIKIQEERKITIVPSDKFDEQKHINENIIFTIFNVTIHKFDSIYNTKLQQYELNIEALCENDNININNELNLNPFINNEELINTFIEENKL